MQKATAQNRCFFWKLKNFCPKFFLQLVERYITKYAKLYHYKEILIPIDLHF